MVVVATLLMGQLALPARAQAGASIHLEIDGGAHPGTYDVTSDQPCYVYDVGVDWWEVILDDPDQAPSSLYMQLEGESYSSLSMWWPAGGGYEFRGFDVNVLEQGVDATISATVTGEDVWGTEATISVRVECHQIDDQRDPDAQPAATPETVTPSNAPQGPPTSLAPLVGDWTGTITVHAKTDYQRHEPGADDDPNSAYYSTWVDDRIIQDDITDTFRVAGNRSGPAQLPHAGGSDRLRGDRGFDRRPHGDDVAEA